MTLARWLALIAIVLVLTGMLLRAVPQRDSVIAIVQPERLQTSQMDQVSDAINFQGGILFVPDAELAPATNVEVPPPPIPARPEPPRLVGIATQDGEPVIWLQTGNGAAIPRKLGETISGWEVIAITDTSARVENENDVAELVLFGAGQ